MPDAILSERLHVFTDAESCPVYSLCFMHRSGAGWLAAGDVDSLRVNMDIFLVLRRRLWRTCTCDLFRRIQDVVKVPRA